MQQNLIARLAARLRKQFHSHRSPLSGQLAVVVDLRRFSSDKRPRLAVFNLFYALDRLLFTLISNGGAMEEDKIMTQSGKEGNFYHYLGSNLRMSISLWNVKALNGHIVLL